MMKFVKIIIAAIFAYLLYVAVSIGFFVLMVWVFK